MKAANSPPTAVSLRIGFVIDRLEPGKGGAEAYLTSFARFLTDRGHHVAVVAAYIGSGDLAAERCVVPMRRLPRALRDFAFDRASARVAREARLDVTLGVRHTPSTDVFQPHGGVYSRAASAQSESAGAAHRRHRLGRAFNPKHRALCRLERMQRAAVGVRYVALSKRVRAHMVEAYRLPAERAPTLIYNGVDLDRFRPAANEAERRAGRDALGATDDEFVVLFVGHNVRLKGLRHVLAAIARIADPRVRLAVVGRAERSAWDAAIAAHGLQARVRFLGELSAPAVAYRGADVLAHPTYYDPCSCVCLEALASGLPVITTMRNGVGELIAADGGDVLDRPDDDAGLAAWIEARAAAPAALREASEAARALAERHPESGAFEAMERVLLDAAAENRR